jgi:hypothetical protein
MCSIYHPELEITVQWRGSFWGQNCPIILSDGTTERDIIAETGNGNLEKTRSVVDFADRERRRNTFVHSSGSKKPRPMKSRKAGKKGLELKR